MSALLAILALMAALLALAVAALASRPGKDWAQAVYGVSGLACAAGLLVALGHLAAGGSPDTLVLPIGLPWLGFHLRLDALSAFFLLLVDLGGAMAALFAAGYSRDEAEPRRILPFFPLFLAAMQLVCLADDAFAFLFAWETMSLVSFALVLKDHKEEASRRAAFLYLLMASLGTLSLLLAFGVMAGADGAYAFEAMRARDLPAWLAGLVLLLVLVGAGSKAGLVPLHAWLPLAHPAAPSHVSALMSGVMTKVAIYGLLRLLMDLAGPPLWWWGGILMVVGAATAVMGLLYALMERDLKRLLAYSTVENIGIVTTALGFAMAFQASGLAAAAALAITAGLLHVLNHAVFKSLLFMGAGAVLHATRTRDMDRLGGLVHTMPQTSLAVLIGAAAISALPPLNGFVSEWLLFQAVLQSPALPQWGLKFLAPAVGAMLALAAALAAACFVRFFGVAFLGRPRSPEARDAHEADRTTRAALLVPAALCLLLGVFPGPVIDLLSGAVGLLNGGTALPLQGGQGWLSLRPLAQVPNSYNGLVLLVFLAVSGGLVALAVHRFASERVARGPIWDCGFPDPSPVTQYTAESMAQPLRRVFGPLAFGAREEVDMPRPGEIRPARLAVTLRDLPVETLYRPLGALVLAAADRLNRLQFLTIRRYLTLMFGALVTLLLVTALWR
jgi:formate hydrogenlyase subunit 3/multisubunit Na+/H+ antiporter MnhD subunit